MNLNKQFTILLASCIALLGMGVSCKDKKPSYPDPGYCNKYPDMCETVMEAKEYFCFKMGSWWVYEEETTLERDSVYVTEYINDLSSPDFDVRVFSEHENYYYHYFTLQAISTDCQAAGNNGISDSKCIFVKRSKGISGDYIGESNCFFIQYWKGASTEIANANYPYEKLSVADVLLSYENGVYSLPKTVVMAEEHCLVENNQPTKHYFSKGVGLVRKELLDSNQVWNLVNYHIVT